MLTVSLADDAVQYASDEIALRLDNPMAQGLKSASKKFPLLNILFPFPGTQTNIIKQFDDMAPAPFTAFQKMLMSFYIIIRSGSRTTQLRCVNSCHNVATTLTR